MNNPIKYATVTIGSEEFHVGIEARFEDGQKYSIASIPDEHEDFAYWLRDQINAGKVPCFAKDKS